MKYFERGLLLEPNDPIWRLSIAKCHRESGNSFKAIECLQQIVKKFPDNQEAIEQLVELSRLSSQGDDDDSKSYIEMLAKLKPKPEIEYDPSLIVRTPRVKHFRFTPPKVANPKENQETKLQKRIQLYRITGSDNPMSPEVQYVFFIHFIFFVQVNSNYKLDLAVTPKFPVQVSVSVSVSNFDTRKIWASVSVPDFLTPKILMSFSVSVSL